MKTLMMGLAGLLTVFLGIGLTGPTLAAPATPPKTATRTTRASDSAGSGAVVIEWNRELLSIVRTPGAQPPTVHATRSFAILHAAIYDAIVSITRDAPPYLVTTLPAPAPAARCGRGGGGHDVLAALYPKFTATINRELDRQLAVIPKGAEKDAGTRVGHAVADRWSQPVRPTGRTHCRRRRCLRTDRGSTRRRPRFSAPPLFTTWSSVTPFVLTSAAQFRPAPPPPLTVQPMDRPSPRLPPLARTRARRGQPTRLLPRSSGQGRSGTPGTRSRTVPRPPPHGPRTDRATVCSPQFRVRRRVIAFYDAKYTYLLWRPISAIRGAMTDGNCITVFDPTWTPLATTPADPPIRAPTAPSAPPVRRSSGRSSGMAIRSRSPLTFCRAWCGHSRATPLWRAKPD